jgi:hypothetical protein
MVAPRRIQTGENPLLTGGENFVAQTGSARFLLQRFRIAVVHTDQTVVAETSF